jgi:hypothetical protein
VRISIFDYAPFRRQTKRVGAPAEETPTPYRHAFGGDHSGVGSDLSDPFYKALPERWTRTDEWYSFAASPRTRGVRVLATLDESSYEPKAFFSDISRGDNPIVWSHCNEAGGRVFYSALGHSAEAYADPLHESMLEGAIAWAAGIQGGCMPTRLQGGTEPAGSTTDVARGGRPKAASEIRRPR